MLDVDRKNTKVFISYSRKDARWLERIQVHLKPLERDGLVDRWDDTRIGAGDKWREEIERAIDEAAVAVFLVSADFLASDFVHEIELPKLLTRAKAGRVRILPIIVGPCHFDKSPLGPYQALNRPERPLSKLPKAQQEAVLVQATRTVTDVVSKTTDETRPNRGAAGTIKGSAQATLLDSFYSTVGQDFKLYTIVNLDSVCGFPNLAASPKQNALLSIDSALVSLDLSIGWEQRQWLNMDYKVTDLVIKFDLDGIRRLIKEHFFEDDFSLCAFGAARSGIQRIELAFGSGDRYYEISIERSIDTGIVQQTGKTNYQQVSKVDSNSPLRRVMFEQLWAFFEPLFARSTPVLLRAPSK